MNRTDDFPATSTPVRVCPLDNSEPFSPMPHLNQQQFDLLPRVANVPPWILKQKDPKFREKTIKTVKFVDDQLNLNKINMRKAALMVKEGTFFKEVCDKRSKDLLRHVTTRAMDKGMKINEEKTGLMCVSIATSFEARASLTVGSTTVSGALNLKVLGVTLDSNCTFSSHVDNVVRNLRSKTWALSRLRRAGLSETQLVNAYKVLIRPSLNMQHLFGIVSSQPNLSLIHI